LIQRPDRSPIRIGAAVGWLAIIGWCTLRPAPEQAAAIAALKWYCVVCGDSGVADVILNILLFIPLGLLLHNLRWSFLRTVLVVAALAIAIEVVQGQFLVGRDACVGDVLSNTLGAALGWYCFTALSQLARPRATTAGRGSALLLVVMAALWLATGSALQPSLSDAFPWHGQPMHAGRGKQPFPGTLQRASINGIEIPNDVITAEPAWRDSIVVEIDATRNSGEIFTQASVMLRIVDSARDVQLGADQAGDDARLRLRLHGSDWKLHNPRWLVPHGMLMSPGEPWRWKWSWLGNRFTIANEPIAGPHQPVISVPLSIGTGWVFIHPFTNIIGSDQLIWTGLWLAVWFGLLGWLGGSLGASRGSVIGVAAIGCYAGASVYWRMSLQLAEVAIAIGVYAVLAIVASLRRGS
jgi:VanZ like family